MKTKRIALVTEAGNGLSIHWAKILQNEGFEVLIAAKGLGFDALLKENLEGVKIVETDLTKKEEVVRMYAYIKTHYGHLDVLINNAEMANGFGQKLASLNMQEVKHLFEENLFSLIQVTQAMMPLLKKGQSSRILNITSALGDITKMTSTDFPYADYKMTAYSMAKAALDMFTVLLSKELEIDNIGVKHFDPVKLKNCTHNSVNICSEVQKEFLQLLNADLSEVTTEAQKR